MQHGLKTVQPITDPLILRLSQLINDFSNLEDLKEIHKIIFESGVGIDAILDKDLNRPLHLACTDLDKPDHEKLELVRYFIEKGADLNVRNRDNLSCFYMICSTWSFDLIKLAVEYGANDIGQDGSVLSALSCTDFIYPGDDINEIVEFLIHHGANVNSYNEYDYDSPLTFACRLGHLKLMKALLKHGANINQPIEPDCGGGPLYVYMNNYKLDDFFKGVKLLVESGADLNDNCYLSYACVIGVDLKTIQYLIDSGARVNDIKVSYNYTTLRVLAPLHQACYNGNLGMIKLLVENGANVNAYANDNNETLPLMITKELKLDKASEYLIKMGANLNPRPPDSVFWNFVFSTLCCM